MVGVAVKAVNCLLLFQESGAVAPNARVSLGRALWRSAVGRSMPRTAYERRDCDAAVCCAPVMVWLWWLQRRVSRTTIARSGGRGARWTACAAAKVQRLVSGRDWLGKKWREYGSDCAGNERREGVAQPPAI